MIDDVPCSLGLSIARQNWTQKILIATISWKFLQKHIFLDSFLHQNLIFYFTRSRNSHTVAIKNTIPRLYDFFDNLSFLTHFENLSFLTHILCCYSHFLKNRIYHANSTNKVKFWKVRLTSSFFPDSCDLPEVVSSKYDQSLKQNYT